MNNTTLNALFSTRAGAGLSVIRILVGIIFMAHGAQNCSACSAVTAWKVPASGWKASAWPRVT